MDYAELTHRGFLLIHKPAGWTSFDVVGYIRKKIWHSICHPDSPAGEEGSLSQWLRDSSVVPTTSELPLNDSAKPSRIKVGHAGTLDPFATGLLIVGVGRKATKHLDDFKNLPKTYMAKIHLGMVSDTGDSTGEIKNYELRIKNQGNNVTMKQSNNVTPPSTPKVKATLGSFTGKQLQTPPMHSAKSVNGVRLYKLARQGKTVERQPNEIEILNIKILKYSWPHLEIEVQCSAGTYIRTLAEDIGTKLGVGAYCEELTRNKIGEYSIENALLITSL